MRSAESGISVGVYNKKKQKKQKKLRAVAISLASPKAINPKARQS